MPLNVGEELQRIQRVRSEIAILSSKNRSRAIKTTSFSKVKAPSIPELRVACIMDEFTYLALSPECNLRQLTPTMWFDELESFKPHLLFIESAWEGLGGQWKMKISHLSQELNEIVQWCKSNNVPTVFWNKEDPIHFETFIKTAKIFDFVFTTDIDCIHRYKWALSSDNVFLLPFAAQPKIHNPIEIYERKDKFCFAGAYYQRYKERQIDFEIFTQVLSDLKGLDIYDRNANNPDPNYAFPERFGPLIVGTLKPNEIDLAYKGYNYGVNMNSIKQSQSMFARRIFELLASNTLTVSNYSRGVRNIFGDLVICTDDGKFLRKALENVAENKNHLDRVRLNALRKVLLEHTYQHRLRYILRKVFGEQELDRGQPVTILSLVKNEEEALRILRIFKEQSHQNKKLVLVGDLENLQLKNLSKNTHLIDVTRAEEQKLFELVGDSLFLIISPKDNYGPNYITDLILGFSYSDADAVGKASFYANHDGLITMNGPGQEYRYVQSLPFRCSLMRSSIVGEELTIAEAFRGFEDGRIIENVKCFSIDRFNYCLQGAQIDCGDISDLRIIDQGLSMSNLTEIAESIKPGVEDVSLKLYGDEIYNQIGPPKNGGIVFNVNDGTMGINSMLDDEKSYFYLKKDYSISDLTQDSEIKFYLGAHADFDLSIVVVFLDKKGNKISHIIRHHSKNNSELIPDGCTKVRFGLRIVGKGEGSISFISTGLEMGNFENFVQKSKVLMIANTYPSYSDLYRNGFVHRRVMEYKNQGRLVDVIRFGSKNMEEFSEFFGIDSISGDKLTLDTLLANSKFPVVLVHFLDEDMWDVLRKFLPYTKIIVWIHGSEVQPWHRREFNFQSDEEKQKAIVQSDKRMAFWKKIFSEPTRNLHFVFVSNYFAKEVIEDVGVRIPRDRYSVIHNFIDTELFRYVPKNEDQRLKILSIRPFASKKYANDLSVKAIQELAKKPIFDKMEFRFIGDGELFEETLKPLIFYNNVKVERKFITQEEMAELHKHYGIFLVPTRMDAQGVSRDEAMSSGLVPVTNAVTAIPEFVDDSCGVLAPGEDFVAMARGIEEMVEKPELFISRSQKAAERVRKQSGAETTITKEMELIERIIGNE